MDNSISKLGNGKSEQIQTQKSIIGSALLKVDYIDAKKSRKYVPKRKYKPENDNISNINSETTKNNSNTMYY